MRHTPMDDLMIDPDDECVPGTRNDLAGARGHEDESPGQMKRGIWDCGEQRWTSRAGDRFAQEYLAYDSRGELIVSLTIQREDMRPVALVALRDLLDTVDPLDEKQEP